MMEKFDKKEYNVNYRKQQLKRKVKAQFNTDLFYNEKVELDKLLSDLGMTKREFILKAKDELERKRDTIKKYLVIKNTQGFEKRGNWIFSGDMIFSKEEKIFRNLKDAEDYYNSIELEDKIQDNNRYSDYKELYEYYLKDFSDEEIENSDYDIDKMKLLKDDYSFIQ